ncbi:MAG: sugar O-acyltransferase (sialic acid O-acetyltransferase NeuD family) [Planctomycetaceae bacterium]|jgi:sugar O-acyltransferase (sialic acid O-acetyltransferase NeuD family)
MELTMSAETKKRLLIIGAGGFGREVLQWAQDIQSQRDVDWEFGGFLDANSQAFANFDIDYPVLGSPDNWQPTSNDRFICAIGDPTIRLRICRELQKRGAEFVSLIHPSAIVGSRCQIGIGTIVCPGVTVTVDVTIGEFVLLNVRSCVGHDARVGDGCTVNDFCDITGNAKLGEGVFLGSHSSVTPSAKVGDFARVGAGSVVVRPVRAHTTVMGPTAKRIDWAIDSSPSADAA